MVPSSRRTTARGPAILALGLLATLVSCSTGEPASRSTSTPGSGQVSPATVAAPTSTRRMRFEQVEAARVQLPVGGGPDWLATGFGSLWVRLDNGAIARVSPAGKVEATIDPGLFQQPVCQGLGVSDVAVWGCATSGRLARIDPRTNKVAAVVDVPKVNDQGRLVTYDGRVWLLTGDGDRLVGMNESSNRADRTIRLGTFCTDVADRVRKGVLWVACAYRGVLLRVDLGAGKVTGRVTGLPQAIAVSAADKVWVGFTKGIAQVNPRSLRVRRVQPAAVDPAVSLRASGDRVWVRETGRTSHLLMRIDASTGKAEQVITTHGPPSGGDVVEFAGAVWASSYEDGFVVKLKPPAP